eukprot:5393687-Alexandrium_andersonii.AAC.1
MAGSMASTNSLERSCAMSWGAGAAATAAAAWGSAWAGSAGVASTSASAGCGGSSRGGGWTMLASLLKSISA